MLLSGGVDSSGVLSFAVENTHKPISTFTVGFDGGCTDERPYARLAAQAFGAYNHEITITAQEFWDFLPKDVRHMEEPCASRRPIPACMTFPSLPANT